MVQQVYFKVSSVKGVPITSAIKYFRLENTKITYPHASISWIFFQNTFKRVTLCLFVLLSLSNENRKIRFRAENRTFLERASMQKWGIGYRPKATQHVASTSYPLTVPLIMCASFFVCYSTFSSLSTWELVFVFYPPYPTREPHQGGTASVLSPHWCGFACMFWITLKYTTAVLKQR